MCTRACMCVPVPTAAAAAARGGGPAQSGLRRGPRQRARRCRKDRIRRGARGFAGAAHSPPHRRKHTAAAMKRRVWWSLQHAIYRMHQATDNRSTCNDKPPAPARSTDRGGGRWSPLKHGTLTWLPVGHGSSELRREPHTRGLGRIAHGRVGILGSDGKLPSKPGRSAAVALRRAGQRPHRKPVVGSVVASFWPTGQAWHARVPVRTAGSASIKSSSGTGSTR